MMRKKMIALSLSSILMFGCGVTKPMSPVTEQEHHENVLNGVLFGLITYAIFSSIKL
jgi:hypothetical protein|tara:strand:+ start:3006 stop:3176 length:171 start_codon:yes stop_codon:yes gene_type:complete